MLRFDLKPFLYCCNRSRSRHYRHSKLSFFCIFFPKDLVLCKGRVTGAQGGGFSMSRYIWCLSHAWILWFSLGWDRMFELFSTCSLCLCVCVVSKDPFLVSESHRYAASQLPLLFKHTLWLTHRLKPKLCLSVCLSVLSFLAFSLEEYNQTNSITTCINWTFD